MEEVKGGVRIWTKPHCSMELAKMSGCILHHRQTPPLPPAPPTVSCKAVHRNVGPLLAKAKEMAMQILVTVSTTPASNGSRHIDSDNAVYGYKQRESRIEREDETASATTSACYACIASETTPATSATTDSAESTFTTPAKSE